MNDDYELIMTTSEELLTAIKAGEYSIDGDQMLVDSKQDSVIWSIKSWEWIADATGGLFTSFNSPKDYEITLDEATFALANLYIKRGVETNCIFNYSESTY